jgi:signal transduction histidine kinase
VDAVAKRHSGHVDVESRLGEGSCFCLKIPEMELQQVIE